MVGVFTKHNHTGHADALTCEAQGLEALRSALHDAAVCDIRVPEVLSVTESEMEITAIASGPASRATLEMLGEGLAHMHKAAWSHYGWDRDNYIGLSVQPNRWSRNWGEFFVQDRLGYQVSLLREPSLRTLFGDILNDYGDALARWLTEHCAHPSLLHGDLWSGNALFDTRNPWLIDPAVYCGDREADIAMTEMFGGFGPAFYEAYDRVYPRSGVYRQKREIYNLYHYLNHLNLFGSGYLEECRRGFSELKSIAKSSS